MRHPLLSALLLLAATSAAARQAPAVLPSGADDVAGNDGIHSLTCPPGKVKWITITGSGNTVTLTGACRRVTISGDHNRVRADEINTVEITGSGNRVEWRSGEPPYVEDSGSRNVVTQILTRASSRDADPDQPPRAPSAALRQRSERLVAAGEPFLVSGTGASERLRCEPGAEVRITGSSGSLTTLGPCARVEITGFGHRVRLESVATVEVSGADHDIGWVGGIDSTPPAIVDRSADSSVRQIDADAFAKGR